LSGPPWWAVRATVAWAMPRVFKRDVFGLGFLQVLSGASPAVKGDPPRLSPTVAPKHLRVRRSGSRRCWSLLIGRPSPWLANAFRGAASADPRV
jgi:hypothetical protein